MIEFVLLTGNASLSGCMEFVTPNNKRADLAINRFIIPYDYRTGYHDTRASINSQTLAEREATVYPTDIGNLYVSDGDYYFKSNDRAKVFLNDFGTVDYEDVFLYDVMSGSLTALYNGSGSGSMATGLIADITGKLPLYSGNLSGLDFFLNGQKIYNGDYILVANTGVQFTFDVSGKVFVIPKKLNITEVSGYYDLFGVSFIENNNNLYVNGMEQQSSLWMEFCTGVSLIDSGIAASISDEINSSQQIEL